MIVDIMNLATPPEQKKHFFTFLSRMLSFYICIQTNMIQNAVALISYLFSILDVRFSESVLTGCQ